MKIGIIGLPNVGKSTLFKALTCQPVEIGNYPFCTINPNVGIVPVPDERLEKLARLSGSQKIISAVVEFVDIAGLVKGASRGEGLGNRFLSHIREVDAVLQVVRVFEDEQIAHVQERINPADDIEIINTELILADLETTEKVKARLEKEARGGQKEAAEKLEVVKTVKRILETGRPATAAFSHGNSGKNEVLKKLMRELPLLTFKPVIYVFNISAKKFHLEQEPAGKTNCVELNLKIEEELSQISREEAKELGIKSELGKLVAKAYQTLDLITFFTTGPKETRAWTIKKGSTAPQAGSVIHTDFEKKFIKAEVIDWQKLISAGSWSRARELGWLRTEGKDYLVRDGDVVEFKV